MIAVRPMFNTNKTQTPYRIVPDAQISAMLGACPTPRPGQMTFVHSPTGTGWIRHLRVSRVFLFTESTENHPHGTTRNMI